MPIHFISFLGTSNYTPVKYSLGDAFSQATPYIQTALAYFYWEELSQPGSTIHVLMTEQAREKHWETEEGLKRALRCCCPDILVEDVLIPELRNEDELWSIFDRMYDIIPPNGEILLDITHGYRSMPLLGAIILDYSRSLKGIKVRAIHYGAIEAKHDGIVPIVDLSRLDRLFRWNRAVEIFIRNGDASGLEGLMWETARCADTKARLGRSLPAERRLCAGLKQAHQVLATVRGGEIHSGKPFIAARKALDELEHVGCYASPMLPLYDTIRSRVCGFKENSHANLLYAIALCIDYNLIQQGITLLQEALVTILLSRNNLDARKREEREGVSRFFSYLSGNDPSFVDPRFDPKYSNTVLAIDNDYLCSTFSKIYEAIRNHRNNINHAGFSREQPHTDVFVKILKEQFKEMIMALSSLPEFESDCTLLKIKYCMT